MIADTYCAINLVLLILTLRWENQSAEWVTKVVAGAAIKFRLASHDIKFMYLAVCQKWLKFVTIVKKAKEALLTWETPTCEGQFFRNFKQVRELPRSAVTPAAIRQ